MHVTRFPHQKYLNCQDAASVPVELSGRILLALGIRERQSLLSASFPLYGPSWRIWRHLECKHVMNCRSSTIKPVPRLTVVAQVTVKNGGEHQ
jgi:hypothetical protein